MPLTPEDVANKKFTTVRLREGYDLTEVDQFLDEVQIEIERLHRENAELRRQVDAGEPAFTPAAPVPVAVPEPEPVPVRDEEPDDELAVTPQETPQEAPEPVDESDLTPVAQFENVRVSTTAEASAAATRLMEMAGRNADELIAEATREAQTLSTTSQADADALLAEAHAEADSLRATAKAEADALTTEAQARADALDGEVAERRKAAMSTIERERAELKSEIGELQSFEREYRTQLKSYFEQQLDFLDSGPTLSEPISSAPQDSDQD